MKQERRPSSLRLVRLGTVPYRDALAIQADLHARRQAEAIPDTLLLLEHPPVYTRGRRAGDGELPLGEAFYRSKGIEVVPTDRGGRVTYHGPGQLVGYPIVRVSDVGVHLRKMEAAIVAALGEYGIDARSRCAEGIDYTGVWVGGRKVASIGVHLSKGVSTHGFAVNVENDLTPFEWIVPCGLDGVAMTSLERELGHPPAGGIGAFADLIADRFCAAHGRARAATAQPASRARPGDTSSRERGMSAPSCARERSRGMSGASYADTSGAEAA